MQPKKKGQIAKRKDSTTGLLVCLACLMSPLFFFKLPAIRTTPPFLQDTGESHKI